MKERKTSLISFVELTIGAIVAAFAIEEFLVPNSIFDGGVTGISMIVSRFVPLPLGLLIVIINAPFIIFAYKKMGHQLVIRMIYAIALFSIMTGVFEPVEKRYWRNAPCYYLWWRAFGTWCWFGSSW